MNRMTEWNYPHTVLEHSSTQEEEHGDTSLRQHKVLESSHPGTRRVWVQIIDTHLSNENVGTRLTPVSRAILMNPFLLLSTSLILSLSPLRLSLAPPGTSTVATPFSSLASKLLIPFFEAQQPPSQ